VERDGQPLPYDIRFGVWVVFEGDTEYIHRCFTEYGLAHGWKLAQPVAAGEVLRWKDVAVDVANRAVRVRREMEQTGAAPPEMVVT
jgi:predicted homoserine dehydrogenase-like protein